MDALRRILRRTILPVTLALLGGQGMLNACTTLALRGPQGILVGNNEDWPGHDARMWVVPSHGDRLGHIYFGFEEGIPQGGINEAGLAFDGLGLPEAPRLHQAEGIPVREAEPLFHILERCHSVAEALAYFRTVQWPWLAHCQLFLADRERAAVIGPAGITEMEGNSLIATNTARTESPQVLRKCARYRIVQDQLSRESATVDACWKALSASHQEGDMGGTQYSMVYDLASMEVHLSWFHDYRNLRTFRVAELLRSGRRSEGLASLAEPTFAAREAQQAYSQADSSQRWVLIWLAICASALGTSGVAALDLYDHTRRGKRLRLAVQRAAGTAIQSLYNRLSRQRGLRVIASALLLLTSLPLLLAAPGLGALLASHLPVPVNAWSIAAFLVPVAISSWSLAHAMWGYLNLRKPGWRNLTLGLGGVCLSLCSWALGCIG